VEDGAGNWVAREHLSPVTVREGVKESMNKDDVRVSAIDAR